MNLSVIRSLRLMEESPAMAMKFRAPTRKECMKSSEGVLVFNSWMHDQRSIRLPEQTNVTLKVKLLDKIGSVFYHLDLNELYSLDNFRGPAGGLKWTLFMNTANQLMEAPLIMPSLLSKIGGKSLGWRKIYSTWTSAFILDALIYACKDNGSLVQYIGDKNQVKLAKKVGMSNLGNMFSALSALGHLDELKYQQIHLRIKSVERPENEFKTNLAQYKGDKKQVKLADENDKIIKARCALLSKLEHSPTDKEVASEAGISVSKVRKIMRFFQEPVSPDTPDETVLHSLLRKDLEELMSSLSDRECKVLKLRSGFDDGYPCTLEEVGERLNLSKETIRKVEKNALRKLKHLSISKKLREYL